MWGQLDYRHLFSSNGLKEANTYVQCVQDCIEKKGIVCKTLISALTNLRLSLFCKLQREQIEFRTNFKRLEIRTECILEVHVGSCGVVLDNSRNEQRNTCVGFYTEPGTPMSCSFHGKEFAEVF